jgi:hypothetical protein
MQASLKPRMELRSRIGRIAAAVGFALVIGSFAGPVRADGDHRGGDDRGRGGDQHRDNDNRGYRGGNNYYAYQQQPDYYYYTPQPNYYAAPDPYYYGSDRGYDAPPPGVSLFFGL